MADVVVHSVCPCQVESQGYFYAGRVQYPNLLVLDERLPGSVRVSKEVTDGIAIVHGSRGREVALLLLVPIVECSIEEGAEDRTCHGQV